MHLLNQQQINQVSGGELVFMTQEWKNQFAYDNGVMRGGVLGAIGLVLGAVHTESFIGSIVGGLAGGGYGFALGYAKGVNLTYTLENNSWYDFTLDWSYNFEKIS